LTLADIDQFICHPGGAVGPYRYLSHPNYAVVAGEIAVLPLVLGLMLAVIFTILNAVVLMIRISVENRALAASRELTAP
jgi:methyltransferase